MKKAAALLLVLVLVVAMVPHASAAGNTVTAAPGRVVELKFTYSQVYGVDGTFELSDPNNLVETWYVKGFSGGAGEVTKGAAFLYSTDSRPHDIVITFVVVLREGNHLSGSATIKFKHATATDAMGTMTGYTTDNATVKVRSGGGGGGGENPDDPTEPTQPGGLDYSMLERQIALANGLNQADYTKTSWETLSAALAYAMEAMESTDQAVIDEAAVFLKSAIAGLVRMDYSALKAALEDVSQWLEEEDLSDLWVRLMNAVNRGNGLLTSGDQDAVNATTAELQRLLRELKAQMEDLKTPETVIQEVEVVVPPSEDFCNISLHQIWPVLFFVSLGLNLVMAAVIVIYLVRKRKNQKDDTPLVDYDIDDDAM
jgi:hypothetical protein